MPDDSFRVLIAKKGRQNKEFSMSLLMIRDAGAEPVKIVILSLFAPRHT